MRILLRKRRDAGAVYVCDISLVGNRVYGNGERVSPSACNGENRISYPIDDMHVITRRITNIYFVGCGIHYN